MVAAAEARARFRRRGNLLEQQRVLAGVLIGPAVLFVVLLVGVPLGLAVYLSLTDATAGSLSGRWVGLSNFVDAWHNDNFRRALRNTIIFTLASQAIVLVGAGLLAHALSRPFRGKWFLRFLILLPWAAPVALSTIGFVWVFDSDFPFASIINWFGLHLHLISKTNPPVWLGTPKLAATSIIVVQA